MPRRGILDEMEDLPVADRIRWKKDDKGRPRRMPASYIMANDDDAAEAFATMRKNGVSHREAIDRIERCFYEAFVHRLIGRAQKLSGDRDAEPKDRRPECWFLLAEGMPIERIFPPDVPERPVVN
jgi:hypothetical protein